MVLVIKLFVFSENELKEILGEYDITSKKYRMSWASRKQAQEANWQEARQEIFSSYVQSMATPEPSACHDLECDKQGLVW